MGVRRSLALYFVSSRWRLPADWIYHAIRERFGGHRWDRERDFVGSGAQWEFA
jgi:hypothetical protein